MSQYIDHSVYPDVDELPTELKSDAERADYVQRICAAWDFDIFPEPETFELFRGWKDVFDAYPLNECPAYHTFRLVFGWEDVPMVRNRSVRLTFEVLDRAEGRDPDPFLDRI